MSDAPRTSMSLLLRLREQPDDTAAWADFVDRYGPLIYTWCRGRGLQDSDARDITQNVLVLLVRKMREFRYDPSKRFRAWLTTVTHNVWHDYVSAQRKAVRSCPDREIRQLLESEEAADALARSMEEQFDHELLDEAVARVRQRVDDPTWEAYRLLAEQGLAGTEVANALGMSVAGAFKAKSRVLKMLQEEVRKLEDGPP